MVVGVRAALQDVQPVIRKVSAAAVSMVFIFIKITAYLAQQTVKVVLMVPHALLVQQES
jgi:hypothetical protein